MKSFPPKSAARRCLSLDVDPPGLRGEIHGVGDLAHLLVPGSTFTGMTAPGRTERPPGSWTPEQVVEFMIAAMAAGDFYIICPDNDVTRDIDNRRVLWASRGHHS